MRCTSPRTVGFKADGKTISFSKKGISKEYATFDLPCGKCISCRLDYARQWAIRCVHESKMYENNSFITLTYDNDHLNSSKLCYIDFQLFIKRLRKKILSDEIKKIGLYNFNLFTKEQKKELYEKIRISYFVTGEYGDKQKRPHWHACVFNWEPSDKLYKYSNERGDKIYKSDTLTELWGKGLAEFGTVTFESAGYCARYAAKKLAHGQDGTHEYEPISKKSAKYAIGKKWLEKYWTDVFNLGYVVLDNGQTSSIPRYYEKWLKANQPEEYSKYVKTIRNDKETLARNRSNTENALMQEINNKRLDDKGYLAEHTISRNKARELVQKSLFKQLQEKLKL